MNEITILSKTILKNRLSEIEKRVLSDFQFAVNLGYKKGLLTTLELIEKEINSALNNEKTKDIAFRDLWIKIIEQLDEL